MIRHQYNPLNSTQLDKLKKKDDFFHPQLFALYIIV